MKKIKNIHNLDTLEKEMFRLKLEAKDIEKKLDNNFEHLQHSFSGMLMNSFFSKRKHEGNGKHWGFDVADKLADHVANKAAVGIEQLVNRIFHKKNTS